MIRFAFRFLGLWILAAAFLSLVIDGTKSIAANGVVITPLGRYWRDFNQPSLEFLEKTLTRYGAEWLWNPVILNILSTPTWLVLGVLGAFFILLGRKKKPLIGYARD